MLDRHVFIGIVPGTGRRPSHYVVLDAEWRVLLQEAVFWRKVPEIVARYPMAMVGFAAPLGPGQALMQQPDVRKRLGLSQNGSTWAKFRVGEYQLRKRGIQIRSTPSNPFYASKSLKTVWELVAGLRELGFVDYRPELRATRQLLEVYPYASFAVLLGHLPFKRNTLEGRLQRQLLLYDCGAEVPEAMQVFEEMTRSHILRGKLDLHDLHSPHELDAIMAALTARYALLDVEQVTLVGDPNEGQIVLPAPYLKKRYV